MKYYTHAGFFHADEVTGYVICRMAGICDELVRLTDISNIPNDGVVADIGREWDLAKHRFDHHQGLFLRLDSLIPYASAGMLWQFYGELAVNKMIESDNSEEIWKRVDETFIQGIDAHDAASDFRVGAVCNGGIVRVLTISNCVAMMNNKDPQDHEAQYVNFMEAANFIEKMLTASIWAAHDFIEAKDKFSEVAKIDGPIVILSEGLPWKEIVHENYPNAKFVISPSNHPGNPWSMIAVPVDPESRTVKVPIERPEWFEGFIHQGKWIAGANSIWDLRKVAEYSLTKQIK